MDLIRANFSAPIDGAPQWIVYLPEGNHTISAMVNGEPAEREVIVTEDILASFQADLADRLAKNVRPTLDFEHKNEKASAIPQEFSWVEGKGLMLRVEWTKSGREAVEGKDWSYFSPEFLLDEDGKPNGLASHRAIGGLVNDPAFEQITRIAASRNPEQKPTNNPTMSDYVKCGLLSETEAAKDDAPQIAAKRVIAYKEDGAKVEAARKDAAEAAAETAKAKEQLKSTIEELDAFKDKAAEDYVNSQVQAGRIPPKDEKAIAFWVKAVRNDENAKAALEALPQSGITEKKVNSPAGEKPDSNLTDLEQVAAKAKEDGKDVSVAVGAYVSQNPELYDEYREKFWNVKR